MKSRAAWKQWERKVATWLGGKRIPVTGRHEADVPDIEHPDLAIEVKATSRQPSTVMQKAQKQAQQAGTSTGKLPVVVQVFAGGQGRSAEVLVSMTLRDFRELLHNATTGQLRATYPHPDSDAASGVD